MAVANKEALVQSDPVIFDSIISKAGICTTSKGVDLTGPVTCKSGNITFITLGRDMTGGLVGTSDSIGALTVGRDLWATRWIRGMSAT